MTRVPNSPGRWADGGTWVGTARLRVALAALSVMVLVASCTVGRGGRAASSEDDAAQGRAARTGQDTDTRAGGGSGGGYH
jgi:hypothetical protein